ncbi:hypothetical protein PR202_gb19687 [Eleusine coracana subsp. coracana]|uniref:Peptidase A1 domain-containing protein n=1 Tax=Eleusine coracana subsp. coracana TaxID=191504 RepID=A0AAV5FAJ5_ELECO|nr:hypothetical protein PR202_gb19687 [Eleusine coracana subsp. coracana]
MHSSSNSRNDESSTSTLRWRKPALALRPGHAPARQQWQQHRGDRQGAPPFFTPSNPAHSSKAAATKPSRLGNEDAPLLRGSYGGSLRHGTLDTVGSSHPGLPPRRLSPLAPQPRPNGQERGEKNWGALTIIGNYQQQNMHVLYDLPNNMLSFVPARCDEV